eukprot:2491095-Prymnesium_polylepis.1
MFPRLLAALLTTPKSRADATVSWVRAIVGAFDQKSLGVFHLYTGVHRTWRSWDVDAIQDAKVALSGETLELHRRKGCGGPSALLEAARNLGNLSDFATSFVRSELLDPAIRAVLRQLCTGSALRAGERAADVLKRLAPAHEVPNALSEEVLLELLQ